LRPLAERRPRCHECVVNRPGKHHLAESCKLLSTACDIFLRQKDDLAQCCCCWWRCCCCQRIATGVC
jgi:hypothetical protein